MISIFNPLTDFRRALYGGLLFGWGRLNLVQNTNGCEGYGSLLVVAIHTLRSIGSRAHRVEKAEDLVLPIQFSEVIGCQLEWCTNFHRGYFVQNGLSIITQQLTHWADTVEKLHFWRNRRNYSP